MSLSSVSLWPSVALVLATLAVYYPSLQGVFVLDDKEWIVESEPYYRDVAGLFAMWLHPGALPQYFPLTGTSFWLDFHFWGLWPLPYHVENVLLHALSALLLWRLLRRLGVRWAWFGAAVFAWHPMMASSVTWITERKNVLSTVFFLAALLAYGGFAHWWERHGVGERARWRSYAWAVLLFLAALMAKGTTLLFPAVVLVICWWKQPRLQARDFAAAIPLFVPGLILGLYLIWAESHRPSAIGSDFHFDWLTRCALAGRSLFFYLKTFFWPVGLSPLYPRWPAESFDWRAGIYPVLAALGFAGLWLARRRVGKGVVAAFFIWAGLLSPVLGFINIAGMSLSFVWDHLAYLANLGLIGLTAGVMGTLAVLGHDRWLRMVGAAMLLALLALTFRQAGVYCDATAIWLQTLKHNPESWAANYNYGLILEEAGRTEEAIAHLKMTLRQKPMYSLAHNYLGLALEKEGRLPEAIAEFQRAMDLSPQAPELATNLGNALLKNHQWQEAAAAFRRALQLMPQDHNAQAKLQEALKNSAKNGGGQ